MTQVVYRNLPMKELEHDFHAIMSSGDSVSLFTDWTRKNIDQVWIKSRVSESKPSSVTRNFHGGRAATQDCHPVQSQPATNCTEQRGIPGPWYERMPHFRTGFKPSAGRELQSEYFIPIQHAYDAIMAVEELHERISPHLFISEIRTVDADQLWMSPCYHKACVTIHTTWKQDWDNVIRLLPLIEEKLAPYGATPHWGKLFTMSPRILHSRYEKLDDFRELVREYDLKGKFRNDFLRENIY